MEFIQEEAFRRQEYDKLVSRIHYDERDAVCYYNMLSFLWPYVIDKIHLEDREGILEEYIHWNGQLIDRCYYHPHDLPYVNARRAWQSVCCLLAGKTEEGEEMLDRIGQDRFEGDGLSPKLIMRQDGTRYEPMSRLFLIYNYAKYYRYHGMTEKEADLRSRYPYAFTRFDDGKHDDHDAFYESQMSEGKSLIYYPVFDRIYKVGFEEPDFYLFYDKDRQIPVEDCLYYGPEKEEKQGSEINTAKIHDQAFHDHIEEEAMSKHSLDTICVQGGYVPGNGEPRQVPIVQSTTFNYESSDAMGRLFDLEDEGYFYTRLQNPTNDYVASKICQLEGGTAAMLTSSGQAASFYSVFNIASCGDHVISSSSIYGGTFNLFSVTMKRMGIDFTFVDPNCSEEELDAAFRPETKAVFGETIANPALTVLDIEKFAKAAHAHGVPLIVDNTFATPVNCRPFEWGADIVIHSTTKYMDGHGSAVGGCIVDSGRFDWTRYPDRFPGLCTPDESYHGITYTEKFGLGGAFITKATAQLMRDFGSIQSPQNAFLLNLGLESLHVRVKRHCDNAMAVASYLADHDKVTYVNYCGLPGDPYHELALKYLPKGSCGVVSFGVKGGRKAAEEFMAHLKLGHIETHVADSRTCCLHPASATHRQMSDAELEDCGVKPDLIRYSCGLEDAGDLIADLAQALESI